VSVVACNLPPAPAVCFRMTPQPGDILLFYNARHICRLITWFTGSNFYHVGIYAGEGHAIEARPVGVVKRDLIAANEYDYLVIPAPRGAGKRALAWAEKQVGDGYDVVGVGALVLERMFDNLHLNYRTSYDKFSCGQFVLCAFKEAGVNLLPEVQIEFAVPADFARLVPAGSS
jgi:uncharacterized protein YycO